MTSRSNQAIGNMGNHDVGVYTTSWTTYYDTLLMGYLPRGDRAYGG
jgi:hypothetical protein